MQQAASTPRISEEEMLVLDANASGDDSGPSAALAGSTDTNSTLSAAANVRQNALLESSVVNAVEAGHKQAGW
jgi:hypothetical protein